MGNHYRKQIRDAAVTLLTGLATTGTRVYPNRAYPFDPVAAGGPGLMVYTIDEDSEGLHLGSPGLNRAVRVAIEAVLMLNEDADDLIDTIATEVETAMGAGLGLGPRVNRPTLIRTQIAFRNEGEKVIGGAVFTFEVAYTTLAADPSWYPGIHEVQDIHEVPDIHQVN